MMSMENSQQLYQQYLVSNFQRKISLMARGTKLAAWGSDLDISIEVIISGLDGKFSCEKG